jgi:hypothetical protein
LEATASPAACVTLLRGLKEKKMFVGSTIGYTWRHSPKWLKIALLVLLVFEIGRGMLLTTIPARERSNNPFLLRK